MIDHLVRVLVMVVGVGVGVGVKVGVRILRDLSGATRESVTGDGSF
jgi:hypothetical protein